MRCVIVFELISGNRCVGHLQQLWLASCVGRSFRVIESQVVSLMDDYHRNRFIQFFTRGPYFRHVCGKGKCPMKCEEGSINDQVSVIAKVMLNSFSAYHTL